MVPEKANRSFGQTLQRIHRANGCVQLSTEHFSMCDKPQIANWSASSLY